MYNIVGTCTFSNSYRRFKNILKCILKWYKREEYQSKIEFDSGNGWLALVQLPESVVVCLHLVGRCDQGELESSQYRELVQKQLLGRDTKSVCDALQQKHTKHIKNILSSW